jgi:dTMP kinase
MLRAAFLEIARNAPERCVVIGASGSPEEIEDAIWGVVKERLFLPFMTEQETDA